MKINFEMIETRDDVGIRLKMIGTKIITILISSQKKVSNPEFHLFLVAVNFWNFFGAGVLGFIINLPIANYY